MMFAPILVFDDFVGPLMEWLGKSTTFTVENFSLFLLLIAFILLFVAYFSLLHVANSRSKKIMVLEEEVDSQDSMIVKLLDELAKKRDSLVFSFPDLTGFKPMSDLDVPWREKLRGLELKDRDSFPELRPPFIHDRRIDPHRLMEIESYILDKSGKRPDGFKPSRIDRPLSEDFPPKDNGDSGFDPGVTGYGPWDLAHGRFAADALGGLQDTKRVPDPDDVGREADDPWNPPEWPERR